MIVLCTPYLVVLAPIHVGATSQASSIEHMGGLDLC